MAKHKIDFDDYEERTGGYDGEQPKKGIYTGRLVSVKDHESAAGNEGLEWIFEITDGEFSGWRGWVYSNEDAAKWKTQQIVFAITGGKTSNFVLDTDDAGAKTVKKAKPVRLRIVNETFEEEKRGKIRVILPAEGSGKKSGKSDKADDDDPFADD